MAVNNVVFGDNFDTEFDVTSGNVSLRIGDGLIKNVVGEIEIDLTVSNVVRGYVWAAGLVAVAGGLVQGTATVDSAVRDAVGRYTVTFSSAHPWGDDYPVLLASEEDAPNRDVRKISLVEGSRDASGFQVQITVDDNGTAADLYVDEDWSFSVPHEASFVVSVV